MNSAIMLIGIGSGGCASTQMLSANLDTKASCVLVDTCWQSIEGENAAGMADVIGIGAEIGKRLGTEGDPYRGYRCALNDRALLEQLIMNASLVFFRITLGGGTGSGAGLALAEMISTSGNIVSVGLFSMPFSFEGKSRLDVAERYRCLIASHLDLEISLSNDIGRKLTGKDEPLRNLFLNIERFFQPIITDISLKFEELGRDPVKLKNFLALKY